MDAAGARALARRIEEQRALEEEQRALEEKRGLPQPAPASLGPPPTVSTMPAGSPLGSQGHRDVRRYTREVRREDVGEGPTVVTTVRCHSLVDGRWQSRVVDVRVEPA